MTFNVLKTVVLLLLPLAVQAKPLYSCMPTGRMNSASSDIESILVKEVRGETFIQVEFKSSLPFLIEKAEHWDDVSDEGYTVDKPNLFMQVEFNWAEIQKSGRGRGQFLIGKDEFSARGRPVHVLCLDMSREENIIESFMNLRSLVSADQSQIVEVDGLSTEEKRQLFYADPSRLRLMKHPASQVLPYSKSWIILTDGANGEVHLRDILGDSYESRVKPIFPLMRALYTDDPIAALVDANMRSIDKLNAVRIAYEGIQNKSFALKRFHVLLLPTVLNELAKLKVLQAELFNSTNELAALDTHAIYKATSSDPAWKLLHFSHGEDLSWSSGGPMLQHFHPGLFRYLKEIQFLRNQIIEVEKYLSQQVSTPPTSRPAGVKCDSLLKGNKRG